ncbi:MAG: sulfite exporter TauE/SafE family protein [Spirochaetota bacterium]
MIVLLILFLAALGSSILSGFLGMGGGVTLLAIMTFFYPTEVLVPLHGMVQLTSNASRSLLLRKYIRKDIFCTFLLGVPLGGLAAYSFLLYLKRPQWVLAFIAAILFYVALKPKKMPEIHLGKIGFFLLGVTTAFLGSLVGATGPILAPFFTRDDFQKEEIVATKAACQIAIHLSKIPIFLSLAFAYQNYTREIILMGLAVVVGTKIGTTLLQKVSHEFFMKLLKLALFLSGVRLLYKLAKLYNLLPL